MKRSKRKRRQGRNAKTKAMTAHAKVRAGERFGVRMTQEIYNQMLAQITGGASEFVVKQSQSRHLHKVRHDDVEMIAVYDPTRKAIRTFLSPEMVNGDGQIQSDN